MPIVYYFWAEWCQPCKSLSPIMEQLNVEGHGFKVVKVNVDLDKMPTLENMPALSAVPTLMLAKNGEVVWVATGAKPKSFLLADITKNL